MDCHEIFRAMIHEGNSNAVEELLSELCITEAKKIINESYSKHDTAIIHIVKNKEGVKRKGLECCQLLLKYGADPNEKDGTGNTALHWACSSRNVDMVTILLESGADPSIVDNLGFNSLHIAVNAGSAECLRMILHHTKELVNTRDENGITPVMTAVQRGDEHAVQVLVLSGAEVNVQENTTRRTALHYALYVKRKDIFEFLMNNGADVTKTDHRGTNIIHRCCAINESSYLQIVLSKVSQPTDKALRMEDNQGATPVVVACREGNIEQLKMIVEFGAPVANIDRYRRCALHHCVENIDTDCAEYLLRSIPSLEACTDQEGLTPLHMAIIAGNIPLIHLLLKRGASLNAVDNEKHTVTHWATVCSRAEVLKILIEYGAELSTPDTHHAYPIHYAAQTVMKEADDAKGFSNDTSNLQILMALLKENVSPEVEDKDKRTPIIWAASAGNAEACRLLAKYGVDVDKADKDDLTALHCAASRGHTECVMALINDCKANVNAVDRNQCTPLFYATTHGHLDCIEVLLELKADHTHRDINGRSAAHCATVSGISAPMDILRNHRIDLWSRNFKGDQPIHEAAQSGHLGIVQYLLEHADNQLYSIDSSNSDGRTCLHIAALTNNVWLCKLLLEQGANINALMKNKGKYYSPYDAAMIKGHMEARDMLYANNGRPGSAITNTAVKSIQLKYRYHLRKRQSTYCHRVVAENSPHGISKVDVPEICEIKSKTAGEHMYQYPSVPIRHDDDVVEKKYTEENSVEKIQATEETFTFEAKYVDKATQVKTHSIKEVANISADTMPDYQECLDNCNNADKSPNIETWKHPYIPNKTSNLYKLPNERIFRNYETDKSLTYSELYATDTSKQVTISHNDNSKSRESKESRDLLATSESQCYNENSYFQYASSLGLPSDTESCTSNVSERQILTDTESLAKRSDRCRLKHEILDKVDKKPSRQTNVSKCRQKVRNEQRREKSSLDDDHCNYFMQRNMVSSKSLGCMLLKGESASSNIEPSVVKKQDYSLQHPKQTLPKYNKNDKPQAVILDSSNVVKSVNVRNSNIVACDHSHTIAVDTNVKTLKTKITPKISAQTKQKMSSLKYSNCYGRCHLSSNLDENCKLAERHTLCSNTDLDDFRVKETRQQTIVTRPKPMRKDSLIQSVQESVKRFECERRSLRNLYQIRRSQIYCGPVNDATLLKKVFVKQSKHSNEIYNAATEYRLLPETQRHRILMQDRGPVSMISVRTIYPHQTASSNPDNMDTNLYPVATTYRKKKLNR